jgi:hypothetical protein
VDLLGSRLRLASSTLLLSLVAVAFSRPTRRGNCARSSHPKATCSQHPPASYLPLKWLRSSRLVQSTHKRRGSLVCFCLAAKRWLYGHCESRSQTPALSSHLPARCRGTDSESSTAKDLWGIHSIQLKSRLGFRLVTLPSAKTCYVAGNSSLREPCG